MGYVIYQVFWLCKRHIFGATFGNEGRDEEQSVSSCCWGQSPGLDWKHVTRYNTIRKPKWRLYTFIGCKGGKQLLYYIIGLKLENTSHSKSMLFFSFGWFVTRPTHTKTNMEPENIPFKKGEHLQATNFGVPAVSFRGGYQLVTLQSS